MDRIITAPQASEYDEFFNSYIGNANTDDLLTALAASEEYIVNLMLSLKEQQLKHRYQPGKWSIKEILMHLADTERIFAYRALCFARNDKTELPGFDENAYAEESKSDARPITSILAEYAAARQATIELFKGFEDEMLDRKGTASGRSVSVRALGFAILGHEIHHLNIIKQRYLI
ncbi:DinB family protein [Pontibacter sp. JH31]|uniref:DinB family protein n=1 Tax=Pontibacter aquaedesilientis TaxID=2766980 RepID=A0ABR7XHV9_9BACT|nr:DinB family protein [Pontibacter aquaedesilientis]MBD1397838.1 DinB family protein [Pontibacter aquaedesilientis]